MVLRRAFSLVFLVPVVAACAVGTAPATEASAVDASDAFVPPGSDDAGDHHDTGVPFDSGAGNCSDWAGPRVTANCTDMCSTHICGPNGCYGKWWCQISTRVCHKLPPTGC